MKMNMKKSITMKTGKKIVSIAIILAMMAGLSACSEIKDRFISDKEKDRIEGENIGKAGVFTDSFEADEEGIVTYFVDGNEAAFTPEKIVKKEFNDFKRLDLDDPVELARKDVSLDDPVF